MSQRIKYNDIISNYDIRQNNKKAEAYVSKFHDDYTTFIWDIQQTRGNSNAVSHWMDASLASALDKHTYPCHYRSNDVFASAFIYESCCYC